jgi:hypothetical protein
MSDVLPALRVSATSNCSFVDQVRPEPQKLHSFERPDGSLPAFPIFRVIKRIQLANRPDRHGP